MLLNLSKKKTKENHTKPFTDHLEDLRSVVLKSFLSVLFFGFLSYLKIDYIFSKIILGPASKDFVTYKVLCEMGKKFKLENVLCFNNTSIRFQSNKLSSQFAMSFTIAFVSGFVISFPYIINLLWGFLKPALNFKEKGKIKFVVFWISFLFLLGVCFGYFVVCPYTISFFASYTLSTSIENIFLISDYIGIVQQVVIGTGLLFQLPLLIYFLTKLDILSSAMLKKYRKHTILLILLISALITPPDVLSQIIVSIPLWFLYEIGILVSIKIERNKK